jgi:hypothetical protein
MHDYELRRMIMNDRIETLQRAAFRPAVAAAPRIEAPDIELRLCKSDDDFALDQLGELSEQPVPAGRLVVALVDGRLVAAVPLTGGPALRDPFVRTAHLLPLLEVRAKQLRQPLQQPRVGRLLHRHA